MRSGQEPHASQAAGIRVQVSPEGDEGFATRPTRQLLNNVSSRLNHITQNQRLNPANANREA